MKKKVKTSREYCVKCYWCGSRGYNNVTCDRFDRTTVRRGCKVGECDKFLHLSPTREEILENLGTNLSEKVLSRVDREVDKIDSFVW